MKYEDLSALVEQIKLNGPTRIMINQFEARPPNVSGFKPDVVFIRKDGWSLGAPKYLVYYAEEMWADEWVFVIELNNGGQGHEYPDWKKMRE